MVTTSRVCVCVCYVTAVVGSLICLASCGYRCGPCKRNFKNNGDESALALSPPYNFTRVKDHISVHVEEDARTGNTAESARSARLQSINRKWKVIGVDTAVWTEKVCTPRGQFPIGTVLKCFCSSGYSWMCLLNYRAAANMHHCREMYGRYSYKNVRQHLVAQISSRLSGHSVLDNITIEPYFHRIDDDCLSLCSLVYLMPWKFFWALLLIDNDIPLMGGHENDKKSLQDHLNIIWDSWDILNGSECVPTPVWCWSECDWLIPNSGNAPILKKLCTLVQPHTVLSFLSIYVCFFGGFQWSLTGESSHKKSSILAFEEGCVDLNLNFLFNLNLLYDLINVGLFYENGPVNPFYCHFCVKKKKNAWDYAYFIRVLISRLTLMI